ncbi:ATP-binding protein [Alkalinema sp. FACHB-956]|uniref:ATP-binding protein n=1 Tax=Alkalinema sp. FACHB-956 TaxID=2692768 RepID=UPI0016825413|nr:ATP-binding protein [Alkalinema sp. FACHB-956]MBD2325408.1 ATP-binding protein [Alkalinema sp. FACHB-956]
MPEAAKQQSNPFSTGGGGVNFETRVQAAFTVLMLSGRLAPCLPPFPITKIKLQGRYAGFNTDDFIVFAKQPDTDREARLLAQIKHDVSITAKDQTFAEVIQSTWNDFKDESFNLSTDALALITGPLSATDIHDVRPILEWARHSANEEEFFAKINTSNFSSAAKRKKLEAFKTHLKTANGEMDVSDGQFWEFLKAFHLIGYDLDTESGSTLSLLHSLIAQYSNESAPSLWKNIVEEVQGFNQTAGTITLETLSEGIRTAFSTVSFSSWSSDITKLKEHSNYILGGIRTTIGGLHIEQPDIFSELLGLTETSSFIFVSGERGSGKSSLIREFSDYISKSAPISPIFCLRTEDLEQSHLNNVFSAMGLRSSLSDIEAGFALMPKKYLTIESLEKLLELDKTTAFTDLLQLLSKHQGWTVIATGRDYAYQQITFNYLQPFGVNFKTLTLSGFSNDQVQNLCGRLEPLQKISENPKLKPLLKSPFFADLAYRVLQTGTEFTSQDGEKEFRIAVWQNVIAKEQDRANGMPLKRKQAFINIAVSRAKQMVYGVPEADFDGDAVFKLEEDNLVRRDSTNDLVSPSHDVLEDWALDQYIEDAYRKDSGKIQDFLDAIGHEPAINRAFRLWLHQKLRCGENVDDFVSFVLTSQDIQSYWQDETIAAILQGDNPDKFLSSLKDRLFLDDGKLLKRFCFILRIACQTPDPTFISKLKQSDDSSLVDALLLRPYGQGWKAIICFLFENRDSLFEDLIPHVTAVLNNWSSLLNLNEDLPLPAREAGLLALHLLAPLKESYRDNGDRKKLLSIIIKTIPAIHEDFLSLLNTDVFADQADSLADQEEVIPSDVNKNKELEERLQAMGTNQEELLQPILDDDSDDDFRRSHRLNYVEEFCKMAFQGVEAAFFCKYDPDTLIKLALFEWLVTESSNSNGSRHINGRNVAGCFGLHAHNDSFSPASGAKGPFKSLLDFHSRKGLDFILHFLNITADKYAHSTLDTPEQSHYLRIRNSEPLIEQVNIHLNDGSLISQYCSSRLWTAYRNCSLGSYVPTLLMCALMALENWLIAYVEHFEANQIELLFEYILRSSNSVMSTAVLASVATGFSLKVGKAALPLLRTAELYHMDRERTIHECGGNEIDWHRSSFDPLSELYSAERRTAALRPWRKEHLEMLVVRLQFSEWRDEALAAIDLLRASEPQDETMRFLLHRIDSRGWKPVEDQENNRIIFEPEGLEPDLKDIQQQTQEMMQVQNRFSTLCVWSRKTFKNEPLETEYYATWHEALAETKELFEELKAGAVSNLAAMYFGGIVTAAAVFVRDYSSELNKEDVLWCAQLIIQAVMANADSDNSTAIVDATDHDGAAAAASILPILLDFVSEKQEEFIVKKLIAIALTHVNENVRHKAAAGIRNHLWKRDSEFAQKCIIGALEYARFEQDQDNQFVKRRIYSLEGADKEAEITKLQERKDEFRERFANGEISGELEKITLQAYSHWYLLSPCLMIPDGSRESSHIKLLSNILNLSFESEQQEHTYSSERDKNLEIHYKIRLAFIERFAKHIFCLQDLNFQPYLEYLITGCDIAPEFIDYLALQVAVIAERANKKEVYWQLWKELSQKLQKLAISLAASESRSRHQDSMRKLIRNMLCAHTRWQKVDYENQDIVLGKDLLLEFVTNAGNNPDVFEALASLMYHFRSIFFELGIHILSKHQREQGGTRLFSGRNTAFYLERAIQHFLQVDQVGLLSRNLHESCLVLLNAIVETASSRAYYLRQHLIRSRKIL